MENTKYIIEINFKGNDLAVTGTFDGTNFKSTTIEPLHEGGQIIIPSFQELDQYITDKKFKKYLAN